MAGYGRVITKQEIFEAEDDLGKKYPREHVLVNACILLLVKTTIRFNMLSIGLPTKEKHHL